MRGEKWGQAKFASFLPSHRNTKSQKHNTKNSKSQNLQRARQQPSWQRQCLLPWWTRCLRNQSTPSPSRQPIDHQMTPAQSQVKQQLQSAGPHQQLHRKSLQTTCAPKSLKRQRFTSFIDASSFQPSSSLWGCSLFLLFWCQRWHSSPIMSLGRADRRRPWLPSF